MIDLQAMDLDARDMKTISIGGEEQIKDVSRNAR